MKSIKNKLIVFFVAVILLVAAILGALSVYTSMNIVRNEVNRGLMALAEEAAKVTESRLQERLKVLEFIANIDTITTMNWKQQQPVLKSMLEDTDFLALAVVYPDGMAFYTDDTITELGDREYVQKAFQGVSNVSDVIISEVTNEAVVMFAAPIRKSGQIAGVLVGRCAGTTLSDITNDVAYGETGYAYMINNSGTFIAHNDNEKVLNQWNPVEEAQSNNELASMAGEIEKAISNKTGVGEYTYENREMYHAYKDIKGTNWILFVTAQKDEVLSSIPVLINSTLVIALIIASAGLVISYLIGHSFAKPIMSLTSILERFADYDLTFDENSSVLKYLKRRDEIGRITGAIERMQKALAGLIKQAVSSAETVGATTEELSASIQEISSNAQNQASTTEEVSSSMEEMTANINAVSDSMQAAAKDVSMINETMAEVETVIADNTRNLEEINHSISVILKDLDDTRESIDTISKKSKTASQEADETVTLAKAGKENLDKTVNQMNSIQNTILSLSRVINDLGESAGQIGDITNLIKDVAEQTNLLALNASIEAARAGEHGKGFAVVAQAIGNLAEESQNATKEIAKVIKNIQAEIGKAVQSSEEGARVVVSGTQLVEETSSSLERIFEAIGTTSEVIHDITSQMDVQARKTSNAYLSVSEISTRVSGLMAAMEEETASAAEIKNKLDAINGLIAEISESMEQQSAASEQVSSAMNDNAAGIEEISAGSEEIARSAEELAVSAQELIEQVRRFKV